MLCIKCNFPLSGLNIKGTAPTCSVAQCSIQQHELRCDATVNRDPKPSSFFFLRFKKEKLFNNK